MPVARPPAGLLADFEAFEAFPALRRSRGEMLRAIPEPAALTHAARVVGLEPDQLRAALDELPGGVPTEARTVTPSPLTPRETEMVRRLADGKVYKQIAVDLDLQASTVRTHVYNTYKTLGVADRAQAVLLATGNGWL